MADGRNTVVVKVGSSSITDDRGDIHRESVAKLCDEVAEVRATGRPVSLSPLEQLPLDCLRLTWVVTVGPGTR